MTITTSDGEVYSDAVAQALDKPSYEPEEVKDYAKWKERGLLRDHKGLIIEPEITALSKDSGGVETY